jgi:hypothetical protein
MADKPQSDNYIERVIRDKLVDVRKSIQWKREALNQAREAVANAVADLSKLEDKERELVSWLDYSKAR